jgi:5-methylcytosine-specific restriction endonuclease McrA
MKSKVIGWSDAKFKGFIVSILRGGFRRYPPKQQCIASAFVKVKINKASGRKAKHYKCAKCKKLFPRTQVHSDHIVPVVSPKTGFVDWNTWIERAFIELTEFQCLCVKCHKIKSAKERQQRKRNENR